MHETPIRRLMQADVSLLRQLNTVFAEAFQDTDTYLGEPPGEAYCREVLGKEHVIVLVAMKNEFVIGGLVAYELDKMERARREIYLYDLAVAEPHRQQGIATRLIEKLRAHCSRARCVGGVCSGGLRGRPGHFAVREVGSAGGSAALRLAGGMKQFEERCFESLSSPSSRLVRQMAWLSSRGSSSSRRTCS